MFINITFRSEIWKNPIYRNNRKDINENGYLTDVILLLLRASLKDLPFNRNIRLTTYVLSVLSFSLLIS